MKQTNKNKTEHETINEKLLATCSHLQEVYNLDTIQILATRHDGERTLNWHPFVGNVYAVLKKAETFTRIANEALTEEIEGQGPTSQQPEGEESL